MWPKNKEGIKIASQILKIIIVVSFDSCLLLFPLCSYYLACFCTKKKKQKQPLKVFYKKAVLI